MPPSQEHRFQVGGMSCAACQATVERRVRQVPDVTDVKVNLLTGDMTVTGPADPAAIAAAVEKAGYTISDKEAPAKSTGQAQVFKITGMTCAACQANVEKAVQLSLIHI